MTLYIDSDSVLIKENGEEAKFETGVDRIAHLRFEAGPKSKAHVIMVEQTAPGAPVTIYGLRSENKKMRLYEPDVKVVFVDDIAPYGEQ